MLSMDGDSSGCRFCLWLARKSEPYETHASVRWIAIQHQSATNCILLRDFCETRTTCFLPELVSRDETARSFFLSNLNWLKAKRNVGWCRGVSICLAPASVNAKHSIGLEGITTISRLLWPACNRIRNKWFRQAASQTS